MAALRRRHRNSSPARQSSTGLGKKKDHPARPPLIAGCDVDNGISFVVNSACFTGVPFGILCDEVPR